MENVMMECSSVAADAILKFIKLATVIVNVMESASQKWVNATGHVPMDFFHVGNTAAGNNNYEKVFFIGTNILQYF